MTYRKLSLLACLLCVLALSAPLRAAKAVANAEALIVVVGMSFPADDIAFAALKSAFRSQRIALNNRQIIPVNHPLQTPMRMAFDRIVLGLEPAAVGRFWVDTRIRDQGRPPTTASTPELALRVVAALAGAVTYTAASDSIGKLRLKVLTVDGKSAGESGYALQP